MREPHTHCQVSHEPAGIGVRPACRHNGGVRGNRNHIEIFGDRVLRYPLTDADRADLPAIAARHEAAVAAGLPAPRVLELHDDHLVLQRLPGTPLFDNTLTPAASRRLGAQLAAMLAALRTATRWPAPHHPWAQLWERLAEVSDCAEVADAIRVARSITPAPVHGDLSGGNILVADDGTLLGVLDWDGATIADPAQDFAAVCFNAGPAVAEAIRAHTPDAAALDRRADAYLATWPVQNLLWRAGRHPSLCRRGHQLHGLFRCTQRAAQYLLRQ